MPPKKGSLNRRGVERREQILDAAVELFAQRGYRASGLTELGERIGISHVGILHHFGTKEGLLRAVVARRGETLDALSAEFEGKGITGLKDIGLPIEPAILTRLETVLRAESFDPEDPLHDYFEESHQSTRSILAAEIRRGQKRGEIRSDVDPEVKAAEIVAFGIGIETQWLLSPGLIDREKTQESFLRSLIEDLTRSDAPRRSRGGKNPSTGRGDHKRMH